MARRANDHIRVTEDTKEYLQRKGNKGETYDEIVRRLTGADEEAK